jgi:hypothetical protein
MEDHHIYELKEDKNDQVSDEGIVLHLLDKMIDEGKRAALLVKKLAKRNYQSAEIRDKWQELMQIIHNEDWEDVGVSNFWSL